MALAVTLAVVVVVLGAGVALALTSGGGGGKPAPTVTVPPVETTATETEPSTEDTESSPPSETTPEDEPSTSTSTPTPAPSGETATAHVPGPVAAINHYWSDIEHHYFSGAYQIERPIAATSESSWVHIEEEEGVESISYDFSLGEENGDEATVDVVDLRTQAAKTGCFTWTGDYGLKRYGRSWKISRDGLERHPC